MSDSRDDRHNNPAQVRGDISHRQTGKRPGFDPAAAPLETDSEAGGNTLSEEEVSIARASQRQEVPAGEEQKPEALSYGTAMRPTEPARRPEAGRKRVFLIVGLLVVAVLIIIALL